MSNTQIDLAYAEIERLQVEVRRLRWIVLVLLIGGTVTWLALVL